MVGRWRAWSALTSGHNRRGPIAAGDDLWSPTRFSNLGLWRSWDSEVTSLQEWQNWCWHETRVAVRQFLCLRSTTSAALPGINLPREVGPASFLEFPSPSFAEISALLPV